MIISKAAISQVCLKLVSKKEAINPSNKELTQNILQ